MLSKQLSIFLENKSGRLTEVTEVLGNAGVNMSAMSIADNSDFGILRCIVSEPDKAYKVLKDAGFTVKVTDVIGLSVPNTAGSLAVVLKYLSDNGVFIDTSIRSPTAIMPMWSSARAISRSASASLRRRRWTCLPTMTCTSSEPSQLETIADNTLALQKTNP